MYNVKILWSRVFGTQGDGLIDTSITGYVH